jgi:hypothetical protein
MAVYALTRIVHGKEDGSRVVVEEGEPVPSGVLDKEVLEQYKAEGLVGAKVDAAADDSGLAAEKEALEQRVAELEAELKQRDKEKDEKPPVNPAGPPVNPTSLNQPKSK